MHICGLRTHEMASNNGDSSAVQDEGIPAAKLDVVKRQAVIVRVSYMGGVGEGLLGIAEYLIL